MDNETLWNEFLEIEIKDESRYIARYGVRGLIEAYYRWLIKHNLIDETNPDVKMYHNFSQLAASFLAAHGLDKELVEYIINHGVETLLDRLTRWLLGKDMIIVENISRFHTNRVLRDAQRRGEFE